MMKIYIKSLNKCLELNEVINNIFIDNIDLFRILYFDINEEVILSKNNNELDLNKNTIIIKNINDININDKKTIALLYKHLEKSNYEKNNYKLSLIKNDIVELLDSILDESEFNLNYNIDFDFSKLFYLTELQFTKYSYQDYIRNIINYFSILNYFSNINTFISYNLCIFFSKEELDKLRTEFESLNITLINFEISKLNFDVKYLIDQDYCIL